MKAFDAKNIAFIDNVQGEFKCATTDMMTAQGFQTVNVHAWQSDTPGDDDVCACGAYFYRGALQAAGAE